MKVGASIRHTSIIECSLLKPAAELKIARNSTFKETFRPISLVRTSTQNFKNHVKIKMRKKSTVVVSSSPKCDLSKMMVSHLAAASADEKSSRRHHHRRRGGVVPKIVRVSSNHAKCYCENNASDVVASDYFDYNRLFYSEERFEKLRHKLLKRRITTGINFGRLIN